MKAGPLERTLQLSKGVGPYRERDLWAQGIASWADFEAAAAKGVVMNARLDQELLAAIGQARQNLTSGEVSALAAMVPEREHWRLYPYFSKRAAFLDVEADGEGELTVAGVMDEHGVATFIKGRNLHELPVRLANSDVWVSFNGGSFDLPVMRKNFEGMPVPKVHLDLKVILRKVRQQGGLKEIEERLGLGRPPHLKGVRGLDAIRLWREHLARLDPAPLRVLVEYNLYDAVNLKTLLEWSVNAIAEELAWDQWERQPVFQRGDVLYDISRLLLGL
ncbi:MAG: ribonuclease H-like domain-containing protein [Myxococcaceae bacterium]